MKEIILVETGRSHNGSSSLYEYSNILNEGEYFLMNVFGEMVIDGNPPWLGQDLAASYKTMQLAEKISIGKP